MRNVTISLDEETARWARIEAAKADTSLSRWIGQLLEQHARQQQAFDAARESYTSRSAQPLKDPNAGYPSRGDLHTR